MKIICRKYLSSLQPVDPAGVDALSKLKPNELVTVEIKRPRNIQHHRLYWALVSKVWENMDQERYPSADDLSAAIKIAAGIRTRIELPNGTVGFIPGSIAFNKMDQDQFNAFYERVCDLIAEHFLPGVSTEDLKREVELMIGAAA